MITYPLISQDFKTEFILELKLGYSKKEKKKKKIFHLKFDVIE